MKPIANFLIALVLGATATAGEVTIFNDLSHPRFVRISHKGKKLAGTWLIPGQRVVVNIDENRPGKPVLMIMGDTLTLNSWGSDAKWKMETHLLAKKSSPLFVALSWYTAEY